MSGEKAVEAVAHSRGKEADVQEVAVGAIRRSWASPPEGDWRGWRVSGWLTVFRA